MINHNYKITNKEELEQHKSTLDTTTLSYKEKTLQSTPCKDNIRYKNNFKELSPIQPSQQSMLISELCSMDKSLAILLAKRIKVHNKLQEFHSTSYEKTLRKSWEKNVQTFSKDPKFIHQLFTLIQHLEVSHESVENALAFSLKPRQQAVNITLNLPCCFHTTILYLTLAICSGSEGIFDNVLINEPIIDFVKALNQLGANLFWENNGTILCKQPLPQKKQYKQPIDKIVHVGSNPLFFYLLIFISTIRPSRIKFIGSTNLKLTDFSSLRSFLPQLGARITNTIPGQEGLPMRIEASAMLPEIINVSKSLPVDAVIALFMATPGWDKKVTINMEEYPHAEEVAQTVLPILAACNISTEILTQNNTTTGIQVTPSIAEINNLPNDAYYPASSALLALPAFTGGKVTLKKALYQKTQNLLPAIELLTQAGLEINETDTEITCEQKTPISNIDISNINNEELLPFAVTISLIPMIKKCNHQQVKLPPNIAEDILDSYLERLGLAILDNKIILGHKNPLPWVSPSTDWSFAYSLAAFLVPGIKLSNPGSVETYFPQYWKIYNSLPVMPQPISQKAETIRPPKEPMPETPSRRRIIAKNCTNAIKYLVPKPIPQE